MFVERHDTPVIIFVVGFFFVTKYDKLNLNNQLSYYIILILNFYLIFFTDRMYKNLILPDFFYWRSLHKRNLNLLFFLAVFTCALDNIGIIDSIRIVHLHIISIETYYFVFVFISEISAF